MSEVSVAELDKLILAIRLNEEESSVVEGELKALNATITGLKAKACTWLKELGRSTYAAPDGSVSIVERVNIKMPATAEDKALLFDWMREKKIYDTYATVHAVSLKSLFLREQEEAMKAGADPITWALPGMQPASVFEDVKFTKARKQ